MMKILNIESSTDICSVSIAIEGKHTFLQESKEVKAHTKLMTILIQACMKEANLSFDELDGVAIGSGPGSYTSLRIGASTAKAIAFAHNIPMIAVSTLKSLANSVVLMENEIVISMIDARRDEVYMGVYGNDLLELIEPVPHILTEASFKELIVKYDKIYIVGNGADKSKQWLKDDKFVFLNELCSAKNMSSLSFKSMMEKDFVDITYFTPNYIKGANITKSKKPAF